MIFEIINFKRMASEIYCFSSIFFRRDYLRLQEVIRIITMKAKKMSSATNIMQAQLPAAGATQATCACMYTLVATQKET